MKIKAIKKIQLAEETPVYDVVNVPETHNFMICNDDVSTLYAVHNCIMDEISFGKNDDANYQLSKMMEVYNQLHVRLGSRFNMNGIIQGRMYLVSSAKATNAVLERFIRDNENEPRNTCK